jgi:ArsR family transcriptional regulator, arsenate/arsenite/antimonite-responsive transcriptional repressor
MILHPFYFDDTGNNVMKKRVEQFSALGHGDRLQIFRLLVRAGPQGNCVDHIKRRLKMPGSTLSHHLDALARSGLLTARRFGRFIYYAINWPETANLIRFLSEDCCADMHIKVEQAAGSKVLKACEGDRAACCEEDQTVAARTIRSAGLNDRRRLTRAVQPYGVLRSESKRTAPNSKEQ